ncbi:PQQ-dependent sugar dehydrogenase [Hyphomonas sp.]|jgi:glucose/arabinose dehydrogenase|uniref:PQQ-dependent sugar dehydrogenase n=1 Tax=Hyphomonas sp. TaxID=87 RepID=UPI0037C1AF78
MRTLARLPALAVIAALAACSEPVEPSAPIAVSDTKVKLEPLVGAEQPWGMAFLADGGLLFTEKEGGLKYLAPGGAASAPVTGLPPALVADQGGYLGLALDPDFAASRLVYVSLSSGTPEANSTLVVRGRLSDDHTALENVEELFRGDLRDTAYHYGSRLAFGNDGTLFVTIGEGYKYMDLAQDPKTTHGKIIRINPDGSIPADNPFADGTAGNPAVWSYGHRNMQGLYFDTASGTLWETEHGPKGGDELNIITRGANYGWPKVTYGVNYDGTVITEATEAEGITAPQTYWVPSIAPSGLTMLTSDVYPGWKGDLFVGGMNGPSGLVLVRIDLEGGKVVGKEDLLREANQSFRDVVQGPDGYLYVANKDFDGIFKVVLAD